MALNASTLKSLIKEAFVNERNQLEGEDSDSAIDRLSTALADAIVNHITENLEVTVQGTGNMGAPVISKSKPLGLIS